jgi:hypothetical protein
MYENPRAFVDALGGYRKVAARLEIGSNTLHGYITAGSIPAKWYSAFIALAAELGVEPPSRSLFSFEQLPVKSGLIQPGEAA